MIWPKGIAIMANVTASSSDDQRWMRSALLLARYGLGRTSPNPAVGCVLVKDGVLIGRGRTADGGRPHAETEALQSIHPDLSAVGATAYVTLEPCAHHGQTPPCSEALINSGISRVVIAASDPDARVAGQGIAMLEAAGVEVTTGVLADLAELDLCGYLTARKHSRPMVTVKIASTLDGRIALKDGRSKWITGRRTRQMVHLMRSQHDMVLTSSGTMRADDPTLTCRIQGYQGVQPQRGVMASSIDVAAIKDSNLAKTADQSRVSIFTPQVDIDIPNINLVTVKPDDKARPDIIDALEKMAESGINSVFVEAGGQFIASLMKAGVVDRLVWTRSSGVIGGDGLPSLADLGLGDLSEGRMFNRISSLIIDDDAIEIFHRR